MLLYCIRHAQSTYNAAGRIQGQADVPLSDLGCQQGEAVAEALAGLPIEAIYASPLRRAVETARPLAQRLGMTIRTDPRLREIHAGVFQHQCREELDHLFPEAMALWKSGDPDFAIPGGESRRDLALRGLEAFRAIEEAGYAQAAVYTHGGLLSAVMKAMLEIPPYLHPFALENGSISQLLLDDGEARLVALNEVCHLRKIGLGGGGDL